MVTKKVNKNRPQAWWRPFDRALFGSQCAPSWGCPPPPYDFLNAPLTATVTRLESVVVLLYTNTNPGSMISCMLVSITKLTASKPQHSSVVSQASCISTLLFCVRPHHGRTCAYGRRHREGGGWGDASPPVENSGGRPPRNNDF